MTKNNFFQIVVLGAVALALAGCGGSSSSNTTTTAAPALTLQQMFGTQFAVDFAANANTQPVVPVAGDIIALSLTTQPIALH